MSVTVQYTALVPFMKHSHITSLWIDGVLKGFEHLGLDMRVLLDGFDSLAPIEPLCGDKAEVKRSSLELGEARRLWHRAAKQSGDPALGVRLGMLQNQRASGVLMPICWHSPTPWQALKHIASFQSLISDNGLYRMHEDMPSRQIRCDYIPSAHSVPPNQQQILSVITGTVLVLRAISLQDPLISIGIPKDLDKAGIEVLLEVDLSSSDQYFSLHLNRELMMRPIEGRDEHLYEINLAYAEGMLRSKLEGKSLQERVKQIIDQGVPALIGIDQVAKVLGLNQRVLQRSLAEQGTSFRQLKERLLKEKAIHFLIQERRPISAIAHDLGYSEVSAFHRAFKSWFGSSPKQFRDMATN